MESIKSFTKEYSFLSNFYGCFISYMGLRFPSVEHAFQAAKSLDPDIRWQFQYCRSAGEAKQRGKMVKLRPDWEEVKIQVMTDLIRNKFQCPVLKQKLLDTGYAHIEEGNSHGDRFWGTVKGQGRNELGKILMKVRDELRNENQNSSK